MDQPLFLQPAELAPPMGPFSAGVRIGDMLVSAGQLPLDADGDIVSEDIRAQARQCFENLRIVLKDAGLELRNVVKLTVWLMDIGDLGAVADVRRELWSPPHPVSTTVEVSRLPNPDALIEVDAIAIAGPTPPA